MSESFVIELPRFLVNSDRLAQRVAAQRKHFQLSLAPSILSDSKHVIVSTRGENIPMLRRWTDKAGIYWPEAGGLIDDRDDLFVVKHDESEIVFGLRTRPEHTSARYRRPPEPSYQDMLERATRGGYSRRVIKP